MKKNILFTLLALVCAVYAQAGKVKIGDLYYYLYSTDNTAAVTSPSSSSEKYSGDIVIPSSVTYDGTTYSVTEIESAFYGCTDITSVTIPGSITNIENKYVGWGVFKGCTGLITVVIGDGVQQIGEETFYGCTSLTSIVMPNSVTNIGLRAFNGCTALTSIVIPSSVTAIENLAFAGCTSLASIAISYGVISIGSSAFEDCTGLTSITIPNSVTSIGMYAFENCTGLTSFTIGNSVTSIEKSSFKNCTSLVSISIPNSVTSIGQNAFAGCTGLTSVNIGNSVTCIGISSFENCTGLTSITIPNSVTSIENYAFKGCNRLMSITLGKGITTIEREVFSDCTRLLQVYYQGDINDWCHILFGGSYANPLCYAKKLYIDNKEVVNVSIPNTVTTLNDYVFYNYSNLLSIDIPNTITSIGNDAFFNCKGLTSVTIPNSVTDIGWAAFSYCSGISSIVIPNGLISTSGTFSHCTNLTSVVLPNSITDIGSLTFSECSSLASITIPNGVTHIGGSAFESCTSLTSVIIPNSVTQMEHSAFEGCTNLESVRISDNLTTIEEGTFKDCSNLVSVIIGNNVQEIKGSSSIGGAFEGCYRLPAVTIPNSVTKLGDYTFYKCSNLKSIKIGTEITEIGAKCFRDYYIYAPQDNREVYITIQATIPPVIGYNTFSNKAIIYAPCETKDLYQAASDWKDYKDQIYGLSYDVNLSATEGGFAKITSSDCSSNTITIEATTQSPESYEFVRWSDGNTENPRTITMTEDINLIAEFSTRIYTISVTCDSQQGKVTGGGEYTYHTDVTIEATPNEGYEFNYWEVDETICYYNPYQIWVSENQTFRAIFKEIEHTITATCDPQQGTVTGAGTYTHGAKVTLTAVANKGYEFAQWSNGVTDNPYLLTATEDLTIEAQFVLATAVENVSADGDTSQKVFRNGQVYILRNGKTYTTTGVEVK